MKAIDLNKALLSPGKVAYVEDGKPVLIGQVLSIILQNSKISANPVKVMNWVFDSYSGELQVDEVDLKLIKEAVETSTHPTASIFVKGQLLRELE